MKRRKLTMKIVVLDGYVLNPGDLSWADFEHLGDLEIYPRTPVEQISERIKDADIILTNKTPLTKETLQQTKALKYIGVLATGYNVVDIKAAKEQGIVVTNIPAYGTATVAQMATALLLEMCHHVGAHSKAVQEGQWTNSIDWCFWNTPLIELSGKTLGIIGFGSIGQRFAKIAKALGMTILAYSGQGKEGRTSQDADYVSFEELLKQSDVISLHCPLFDSTKGIINAENIQKMKDGVMIINTARGPLIVEEDLADALNSGKVAGAALDVLFQEPPSMDNPLMKAKNCIITPHIAWASQEARQRLMSIAIKNLEGFLQGKPHNIVNE